MIRPTAPEDTPALVALTQGTGVFRPHEIDALREVLDDYHAENHAHGHQAYTYQHDGDILGYVYYAPAAMTVGTWYLYWIAVKKTTQARGIGSVLLRFAEDDMRRLRARVLFLETSSLPAYELTRKFYLNHDYEIGAVLRDYYCDGDDMVVFRKRLPPTEVV